MAKEKVLGITLPGWLRYGLDSDGVKPTEASEKSQEIRPMSEQNKVLAKVLSDELWTQRMAQGDDVAVTLRGQAVEGLEKLLWALAEEDYSFANVRIAQLIRGLLEDAPLWQEGFDSED